MKYIQLLENYSRGDGVGMVVNSFDDILDDLGVKHEIIGRMLVPSDIERINAEDILLYHLGVSIDPLVFKLKCRKILVFHNITEPELIGSFDNYDRIRCGSGLYELRNTSRYFNEAICFSDYSQKCLIDNGWIDKDIHVIPILVQRKQRKKICKVHEHTLILFGGRVYPNKKQEDIIAAFSEYLCSYDKEAELFLVGSVSCRPYLRYIKKLVNRLGIEKNVHITGHVSDDEYEEIYSNADVFLCMSEHEGFCIPLVEAMTYDIPIIAYDAAAVKGTLGGCGVLLDNKAPEVVAEYICRLVKNKTFREEIISGQRKRLDEISDDNTREEYAAILRGLAELGNEAKLNVGASPKAESESELYIGIPEDYLNQKIVVYGAGAAGTRVYLQLHSIMREGRLYICDTTKAGEYLEGERILVEYPDVIIKENPDAYYIVSVQNRGTMVDIVLTLLSKGITRDHILTYDKILEEIV